MSYIHRILNYLTGDHIVNIDLALCEQILIDQIIQQYYSHTAVVTYMSVASFASVSSFILIKHFFHSGWHRRNIFTSPKGCLTRSFLQLLYPAYERCFNKRRLFWSKFVRVKRLRGGCLRRGGKMLCFQRKFPTRQGSYNAPIPVGIWYKLFTYVFFCWTVASYSHMVCSLSFELLIWPMLANTQHKVIFKVIIILIGYGITCYFTFTLH